MSLPIRLIKTLRRPTFPSLRRKYSDEVEAFLKKPEDDPCRPNRLKGLVLGYYTNPDIDFDVGKFTPYGERYDQMVSHRLSYLMRYAGPPPGKREVRVFYNLDDEFPTVAVTGLGRESQGLNLLKPMDLSKEAIRIASAAGCRALQKNFIPKAYIDSFNHTEWIGPIRLGSGREFQGYDVLEQIERGKKAIRIPSATGCEALQDKSIPKAVIESYDQPEWIGSILIRSE